MIQLQGASGLVLNNRFPYPFIYLNLQDLYSFIYVKPEKLLVEPLHLEKAFSLNSICL